MPTFKGAVEWAGYLIDGAGVLATILGVALATLAYVVRGAGRWGEEPVFRAYRQNLGRSILLGLELLVAGDIIRTVAVEPTLQTVAVLGVIVLIRTFLSMSLQVELEGRWPWQAAAAERARAAEGLPPAHAVTPDAPRPAHPAATG